MFPTFRRKALPPSVMWQLVSGVNQIKLPCGRRQKVLPKHRNKLITPMVHEIERPSFEQHALKNSAHARSLSCRCWWWPDWCQLTCCWELVAMRSSLREYKGGYGLHPAGLDAIPDNKILCCIYDIASVSHFQPVEPRLKIRSPVGPQIKSSFVLKY
jgi:hypothetical protein